MMLVNTNQCEKFQGKCSKMLELREQISATDSSSTGERMTWGLDSRGLQAFFSRGFLNESCAFSSVDSTKMKNSPKRLKLRLPLDGEKRTEKKVTREKAVPFPSFGSFNMDRREGKQTDRTPSNW